MLARRVISVRKYTVLGSSDGVGRLQITIYNKFFLQKQLELKVPLKDSLIYLCFIFYLFTRIIPALFYIQVYNIVTFIISLIYNNFPTYLICCKWFEGGCLLSTPCLAGLPWFNFQIYSKHGLEYIVSGRGEVMTGGGHPLAPPPFK